MIAVKTTDIFCEIKARLTAGEVAELYGYRINRGGFICCPFHEESTPSMKVYPGSGGFHCFGCGASGDVIELTARLYGLTAIEAVKRLNEDFFLHLPLDKPPDRRQIARQIHERQEDNRIYEGFQQWEQAAFRELCALSIQFREDMRTFRPLSPDAPLPPHIIAALQNRERVEYLLDILMSSNLQDKIELYKSKEVEQVVKRCKNQKLSAS